MKYLACFDNGAMIVDEDNPVSACTVAQNAHPERGEYRAYIAQPGDERFISGERKVIPRARPLKGDLPFTESEHFNGRID